MRLRSTVLCIVALVAALAPFGASARQKDRLTADLFLDWEMVAAPRVSPDGKQIVYTRRWTDKVNDKYEDEVWIMDADGGRNRFLVKGSQAAWSPDSKRIAYVAPGQPAGTQVFVRWMDAPGETQLTRLERSPSNLAWSPDGRHLAFNMLVPGTPGLSVKMPARPAGAKWVDAPRVVDRSNYRSDGSGWRPEGFTHIFVMSDEGGAARQLTEGDYQHGAPEWMQRLALASSSAPCASPTPSTCAATRRSTRSACKAAPSASSQTAKARTTTRRSLRTAASSPTPAHDQNDNTYNVTRLYVMNADGTNRRALTDGFDRAPSSVTWTEDGGGLLFVTEDRGSQNLWYVRTAAGGSPRQLTTGVHVLSIGSVSRDGLLVGTRTSAERPADLFSVRLPFRGAGLGNFVAAAADLKRLTSVNDDLLEGRKLGQVEEIWYDSVGMSGETRCTAADSSPAEPRASDCSKTRVQGWIVKPPDFDPSKKYPLLLYIHGGPHSMYGVGFNFEFQNHAADGYVVLYTNPRGSTGYGAGVRQRHQQRLPRTGLRRPDARRGRGRQARLHRRAQPLRDGRVGRRRADDVDRRPHRPLRRRRGDEARGQLVLVRRHDRRRATGTTTSSGSPGRTRRSTCAARPSPTSATSRRRP